MKAKKEASLMIVCPKELHGEERPFSIDINHEFRDILNEIEDNRHFSFGNCDVIDFVRKVAPNPSTILSRIKREIVSGLFIFYYNGMGISINDSEYFMLQNSYRNREKSLVCMSELEETISSSLPINSRAIIIYEGDFREICWSNIKERSKICKIIINHKGKEPSIKTKTLFSTTFQVGMFIPEYGIDNLIDFMKYNSKGKSEFHYFGDRKILIKRFSSYKSRHRVWNLSPHNFASENPGSREDGIQEIKYALSDLSLMKEASNLLNYLYATETNQKVRESIKAVLNRNLNKRNFGRRISIGYNHRIPTMEWKKIPKGKFIMGSDLIHDKFSLKEEQPMHTVMLDEFFMAKSPVSVADWRRYIELTGQHIVVEKTKQDDSFPITGVTWYEAVEYGIWLTTESRKQEIITNEEEIRLPTEAEWEKACRGTNGRHYPWGNKFIDNYCNYRDEKLNKVIPIGLYSPRGDSPYGIHDMCGNVWEWTLSNWGRRGSTPTYTYPYNANDGREDVFASPDVRRVIRGGSYYYFDYCLRCCTRNLMYPDTHHSGGGIRLVKSKKKYFN